MSPTLTCGIVGDEGWREICVVGIMGGKTWATILFSCIEVGKAGASSFVSKIVQHKARPLILLRGIGSSKAWPASISLKIMHQEARSSKGLSLGVVHAVRERIWQVDRTLGTTLISCQKHQVRFNALLIQSFRPRGVLRRTLMASDESQCVRGSGSNVVEARQVVWLHASAGPAVIQKDFIIVFYAFCESPDHHWAFRLSSWNRCAQEISARNWRH